MSDDIPSLSDLPMTLDDIVRRNRDLFEVDFATEAELGAVTGGVDLFSRPRGRIDSWRVIALRDHVHPVVTLHVLGRFQDSRAWMTSPVAVMTPERSFVRTRNSLYALGEAAQGEPDITLLLHVAFVLRHWGLDRH